MCFSTREGSALRQGNEQAVDVVPFAMGGHHAVEILFHHGNGAADQVAQIVGQIGVDAGEQGLIAVTARPLPKGTSRMRIIADGVACRSGCTAPRGLPHCPGTWTSCMPSSTSQPWPNTCLGRGRPSACKMMGHVDGVETDDLLADQVDVGGPVLPVQAIVLAPIAQGGNIVGERIQPHVHGMLGIKIDRHAPLDGGAADAQVLQAGPAGNC